MGTNIQPERINLLQFFERLPNSQFVIPVYQRNYIWTTKKQVKKFLEDYRSIVLSNKPSHFIGIIMYLSIQTSIGFQELSIVDGQQRIVTTFLMLQALKELASDMKNVGLSSRIEEQFLINKYAQFPNQKLRLKPLISDDNVYSKIINHEDISKADKKTNVFQNFKYIKEFLKNLSSKYSLEELFAAIDKFYFVAIPLSSNDNAQEIFESINSTGADLSKSDLIRNYILMNIGSDEQENLYNKYWRPLELKFNDLNKLESFFRMFLANQSYNLCDKNEVYEKFQSWYSEQHKTLTTEDILKKITQYASYYVNIFIADDIDVEKSVAEPLKEFKRGTIEPTAPMLMEIYALYNKVDDNGNRLVSGDDFGKIISLFNTYNIRRNMCNLRTGVLTRIVPPMLRDVINDCGADYKNIYNCVVKYLVDSNKGKASFMPDDEYLRTNLANINAYSLKSYLRLVLEKMESYNNPAVIDFSNLSIEHLMPQTPTQEWLDSLHMSQEEYEHQLNRLGNLTLATHPDNSKMSNNAFDYKKEILSNTSHLKINQEILEKDSWGEEEIEERTNLMIDRIIDLYPYITIGTTIDSKYSIFYDNDENNIKAYIYDDYTVEVISDSIVSEKFASNFNDAIDNNSAEFHGEKLRFIDNYRFGSLAELTNMLTNLPDVNEWEVWKDNQGDSLSVNIRTIIGNKAIK